MAPLRDWISSTGQNLGSKVEVFAAFCLLLVLLFMSSCKDTVLFAWPSKQKCYHSKPFCSVCDIQVILPSCIQAILGNINTVYTLTNTCCCFVHSDTPPNYCVNELSQHCTERRLQMAQQTETHVSHSPLGAACPGHCIGHFISPHPLSPFYSRVADTNNNNTAVANIPR